MCALTTLDLGGLHRQRVVMVKLTNVLRMRLPAPSTPSTQGGGLRYRVETDIAATTIYLAGSLREGDFTVLRDVLRGCLTETPSVIIVDLTALGVIDQDTLGSFGSALESGRWPGGELLVAGARGRTHSFLTRRARFTRCFDTRDEAAAAAAARTGTQRFSERLHPRQGAARKSHRLITEACATWELDLLAGAVHIAGAELVANAVRHAGTDVVVTLALRPRALHLAVRDGSQEPPRIYGPHHPRARRPQGLLRIDGAADEWGVTELADGKLVWASWSIGDSASAAR